MIDCANDNCAARIHPDYAKWINGEPYCRRCAETRD
jgi:hypothetical protein